MVSMMIRAIAIASPAAAVTLTRSRHLQVMEHVSNPLLAMAQVHRALKPGGRVIILWPAFNPYHRGPRDFWRVSADSLLFLAGIFSKVDLVGCYSSKDFIRYHLTHGASFHYPTGNPTLEKMMMGHHQKSGGMNITDWIGHYLVHCWLIASK